MDVIQCPAIIFTANKGGTGKSLKAINTAIRLSKYFKVALLDADVDASNMCYTLGISGPMKLTDKQLFIPADYKGIKVMSVGLFQKGVMTMCKTGIETNRIVRDMIKNTVWGDIDVLVIDAPAGVADKWHGILESGVNLAGVIIISQPTTYDDCYRIIEMCSRFGIPIMGIIENMVGAVWSDGTPVLDKDGRSFIPLGDPEGDRDIEALAKKFGVRYLGAIPLVENMYGRIKSGNPVLPDSVLGPIDSIVDMIKYILDKKEG